MISFAAGEPNFPTPDHVVHAAARALHDVANHRYTPVAGLAELRGAIADATSRDCSWRVDPSQVLVTNGGKQAVFQAFQTVLNRGDEVLLPTPYWTTYPEAIRLAEGVPVEVFAGADQDYKVTVSQLEAARSARTTALVLVSPSNPTGMVYDTGEMRAIGEWALQHGIWVISDDIYRRLVYGDLRAASVVEEVPDLARQTIVINGVAKTYAMTGWRVGWMIGPADVIKVATNLQSHLTSNVNNIAQRAALAALTGPQQPVAEFINTFGRRRQLMLDGLSKIEGLTVPSPDGAFYIYPDVRGLLGRPWGGRRVSTSLDLAELILDRAEVAAVPGEAFGPTGYLRFSFAASDRDISEGIGRLQRLFAP
ncbi:pyridoxal phosphate-dependent aminotransferase [Mycobacterium sp. 236(2023)]|uniref:pyridoxal phosphate-dependent aminotransferase n=1 Tax=Mycobacterium sp. 236(2023) TaxID=3038163 RepID=UPI0024154E09|nr:pyridoxal phosphate-dependent aminotransferase [Mycobacterium sp. 236(2023)]MDG4669373.1 pyridoxal phosphate-dependent aminotransferase [Mycobacterium sp. 236(2023)]